jgi:hypothetical protein
MRTERPNLDGTRRQQESTRNKGTKLTGRERGHQTQWAAQFAVASELCKRGYEVAFTSGHTTPIADLMVVSPCTKTMFLIDVKGLYRMNPWVIKRKPVRSNLFYVLAFVPTSQPNRYFVLSQKEINQYVESELARLKRPEDYPMTGITFMQGRAHEDSWAELPQ